MAAEQAQTEFQEIQSVTPYLVSSSPHLRTPDSVSLIMWTVVAALAPAWAGSVFFFGFRALFLTIVAIVSAVATEYAIQKLRKVETTVGDGSAVLTGLLLAFNIPAGVPWWIAVLGSAFAIAIGKQAFGGLGFNLMNPALLGRAFLLASWPVHMTMDWTAPRMGTKSGFDAITGATPLTVVKEALKNLAAGEKVDEAREILANLSQIYDKLFLGNIGGCIGETSVILLLIGAAYLMYKRYIDYRVPAGFIGAVAFLAWIVGGEPGYFTGDPLFHVLAGGVILGAFFMATDMVTCPTTPLGMWIFGIGCGLLTVTIRNIGGYPEGVSYSILLMNLTVPLIDRYTKPTVFGAHN